MSIWRIAILWVSVCLAAVCLGVGISLGAWWFLGQRPFSLLGFAAFALFVHVHLIGTFTIMGENSIEDAVKGVLFVGLSMFVVAILPAIPCAVTSAAILAACANVYTKRLMSR
jgi:disulfide bond formation protein DsbB